MRGRRRYVRCSCLVCSGRLDGGSGPSSPWSRFGLLAGFVLPLALIGGPRSAPSGKAGSPSGPTIERDGGVVAPVSAFPGLRSIRARHLLRALGLSVTRLRIGTLRLPDLADIRVPAGPPITSTPAGDVPARLVLAMAAANRISRLPYIWGGGHGSFDAAGYDCSGSVSYVLHAADVLASPEDSSALENYGAPGPGRWITIYANASHAFMTLGGLRYDTIGLSSTGSRWQPLESVPAGYVVRHPVGL